MKTPKDIEKALEHCFDAESCVRCPYSSVQCAQETTCGMLMSDMRAHTKQLEAAMGRLGKFGKLFMDYEGCPRGAVGRLAAPIEEEVMAMKPITDVDGGKWIPVNADALHDLVKKYNRLEAQIELMKLQMHGDCGVCKHRNNARITKRGPRFDGPCETCIQKEARPNWEYEGLTEVNDR